MPGRPTRVAAVIAAGLVLLGCGPGPRSGPAAVEPTVAGSGVVQSGWEVTVYYTAVESFHDGVRVAVTGCPVLDCENGDDPLGRYPRDFVTAVKDEGTGRITSGAYAGRYLNWSYGVGYWLDTEARNSHGEALRPYVSAATDADVLPRGSRVEILVCGDAEVERDVCAKLREPTWTIDDEFTPGLGGARHLDVYLGEEDRPGFTESPLYTTLANATLRLHPAR